MTTRNANIKVYNAQGEQLYTNAHADTCMIDATACGWIEWDSYQFFSGMLGYKMPDWTDGPRYWVKDGDSWKQVESADEFHKMTGDIKAA